MCPQGIWVWSVSGYFVVPKVFLIWLDPLVDFVAEILFTSQGKLWKSGCQKVYNANSSWNKLEKKFWIIQKSCNLAFVQTKSMGHPLISEGLGHHLNHPTMWQSDEKEQKSHWPDALVPFTRMLHQITYIHITVLDLFLYISLGTWSVNPVSPVK